MATNSSQQGPIAPVGAGLIFDQALENFIQSVVAGICGLPGAAVRPRWQQEPPNLLDINTDWCAVGELRTMDDAYGATQHDGAGEGSDNFQRNSELTLVASFYGPNGQAFANRLSDGFLVSQNREVLRLSGFGFKESTDIVNAPAFIKDKWYRKYDLQFTLVRMKHRVYPVLNIQQLILNLQAEFLVDSSDGSAVNVSTNIKWPKGIIQFSSAVYSYLLEDEPGTMQVTLLRIQGSDGLASADVKLIGGTAALGVDYIIDSTLHFSWGDGDNGSKFFNLVMLTEDFLIVGKTAIFRINHTTGASIGPISVCVVIFGQPARSVSFDSTDISFDSTLIDWSRI